MKSTAPSFIARTASGTSPWPVITITGQSMLRARKLGHHREAVDLRHAQVEQDAARLEVRQRLEEIAAAAERVGTDLGRAEQEAQRPADVAVVVDHIDIMAMFSVISFGIFNRCPCSLPMGPDAPKRNSKSSMNRAARGTRAARRGLSRRRGGTAMAAIGSHSQPSEVNAEQGEVIVEGPDGVAVTLTPTRRRRPAGGC